MKKILIADDDDHIRLFLEKNLRDAGYEILHAGDGEEAMRMVREEQPDLVLLDLYMPKMHGYEVCRHIRADADPKISSTKIVVISVKGYATDIKTAKEVGANHYLVKPHSLKDLMAVVDKEIGPADS